MGGENHGVTLGSLATFINGDRSKNYPSQSDRVAVGIPFVNAADLVGGSVCFDSAERITKFAFDRLSSGKTDVGDILFCLRGTPGRVARNTSGLAAIASSLVILRPRPEVDERYLFYLLSSPAVQADCSTLNNGSAQPNVSAGALGGLVVEIPSLKDQHAIAHILGTLDDKIELNRRRSETLEAMARALFQSWFVNFDPVRAKQDGCWQRGQSLPGLPAHLYDLFPDRLVDSELGEIPEGWEVGSIYEAADVIYGAPFSSSQFNTERVGEPLIRIRDLATELPKVWTPEIHPKGYRVRPGDIAVGMDGEFRAYLWGGPTSWLNQRVCVFKPKLPYSTAFVRNAIVPLLAEVEATETATTVIHLGKADIDGFRVTLPSPELIAQFNESCQRWYDSIVKAKQESRSLATLRDTLLPKLISGELRVPRATRLVEEIA